MPRLSVLAGGLWLSIGMLGGCTQNPSTESTPSIQTSSTQADKKKPTTNPKAMITPVGVKTIKPETALKPGHKLSPEEVEDLIRKLSVCRPS